MGTWLPTSSFQYSLAPSGRKNGSECITSYDEVMNLRDHAFMILCFYEPNRTGMKWVLDGVWMDTGVGD